MINCSSSTLSRRKFALKVFSFTFGGSWATAQLARLDATKSILNGTNVMRVVMTYSPPDTVWELKFSTEANNTNSWSSLSTTNNTSNYAVVAPGKVKWDFPFPTNGSLFLKSKLVGTNANVKLPSGTSYPVLATGETLFEAMIKLASSTAFFAFSAKNYVDLGQFILDINGVKNANGSYWTLYVNGQMSTMGCSQYVLKPRDKIEWRFENKS